jgi:rubrerythrin
LSFAERLNKGFQGFRKSIWFRALYLVLLGLVVGASFPFMFAPGATACLFIIAMPIMVFAIPYLVGERNGKHFLINILPVAVIAILFVAAFQANASMTPAPVALVSLDPPDAHITIFNGTIAPFRQQGPATFNFTARVASDGTVNLSNVTVYLNLTTFSGLSGSTEPFRMTVDTARTDVNNTTNVWYYVQRSLPAAIYEFGYYANDTNGNWTTTYSLFGPIAAGFGDYFVLWIYGAAIYLAIPFAFYFIILFMYWYTGRTRRMRARMIELEGKAKEEAKGKEGRKGAAEPKASKKAAAYTCTNCGADVTEDDEKCPKCGASFED